jgi:hypothetical protein
MHKPRALPLPYKDVKQGVPEAEFSIQFLLPLLLTPNDNYTYIHHLIVKSLCLINQAKRHEDAWESGVIAPPFLTLALDRSEWSASRPGRFTPRGKSPVPVVWEALWVGEAMT